MRGGGGEGNVDDGMGGDGREGGGGRRKYIFILLRNTLRKWSAGWMSVVGCEWIKWGERWVKVMSGCGGGESAHV